MPEVLCVLLPLPESACELRLRGAGLVDWSVWTLRTALPRCSVISAPIGRSLGELVDSSGADLVVLHDPVFPFVSPTQVIDVCAGVIGAQVAAVAVTEVTDTLELVDDEDQVVAGLDRSDYLVPVGPLAISAPALAAALAAVDVPASGGGSSARPASAEAPRLPELVGLLDRLVGVRRVRLAPGTASCRVEDVDTLAYARAVLASRTATATSPG